MGVAGQYVRRFCDGATHALPQGMSMNANYPFMLPRVELVVRGKKTRAVLVSGDRRSPALDIKVGDDGQEYCTFAQSSHYETIFHKKPTRFRFFPFRADDVW